MYCNNNYSLHLELSSHGTSDHVGIQRRLTPHQGACPIDQYPNSDVTMATEVVGHVGACPTAIHSIVHSPHCC